MQSEPEDSVSRSVTTKADVECIVASVLHDIRYGEHTTEGCIYMDGKIGGPHERNEAELEVQCHRDFVSIALKIQTTDIPTDEITNIDWGSTALADYGSRYEQYAKDVGEAVTAELGIKTDSPSVAALNGTDMRFEQEYMFSSEKNPESDSKMKFTCTFDRECFRELDEMWGDTE